MWECYIIYLITHSMANFGISGLKKEVLDYIILLFASSREKRYWIFLF